MSENPAAWLRPGDTLMAGGFDWAWCYVVFADIPDFPGYAASSLGEIWTKRDYNGGFSRPWHRLAPSTNPTTGYRFVQLRQKAGRRCTVYVHTLVLRAFSGMCPEGMVCRHRDGDKLNNGLGNITWGTRVENEADKRRHGRTVLGSRIKAAKLTEQAIPVIRNLAASGISQRAIGSRFGVDQSAISCVISGKTWSHVQ